MLAVLNLNKSFWKTNWLVSFTRCWVLSALKFWDGDWRTLWAFWSICPKLQDFRNSDFWTNYPKRAVSFLLSNLCQNQPPRSWLHSLNSYKNESSFPSRHCSPAAWLGQHVLTLFLLPAPTWPHSLCASGISPMVPGNKKAVRELEIFSSPPAP